MAPVSVLWPPYESPDPAELLKARQMNPQKKFRSFPLVSSPRDPIPKIPSDPLPRARPHPSAPDSVHRRRLPEGSQTSPSGPETPPTPPSGPGNLRTSPSVSGVPQILRKLLEEDETKWRLVGVVSIVVALFSCALSPTFHRLIRGWNFLKSLLYLVVFLVIFATIVFARQSSRSKQHVLKKIIGFAVLMFMAVFTLYYDKALNGKPDIPGLVSTVAFALVSLSLFKLINFGQEMGLFTFSLSCFASQLWTIHWWLIFVAIIVGYPLFHMHSSFPRDIQTGLA